MSAALHTHFGEIGVLIVGGIFGFWRIIVGEGKLSHKLLFFLAVMLASSLIIYVEKAIRPVSPVIDIAGLLTMVVAVACWTFFGGD